MGKLRPKDFMIDCGRGELSLGQLQLTVSPPEPKRGETPVVLKKEPHAKNLALF